MSDEMLRCECPCGCENTSERTGFFSNATEATLAAMAGEVEHPTDYPMTEHVCEPCFCGDWPDRCGKATYVSFEDAWRAVTGDKPEDWFADGGRKARMNPMPAFGLRPQWEWDRINNAKRYADDDDLAF